METVSSRWKGIDGSFARTVVGGEYPTPVGIMNEIAGPVTHFQFVTSDDCVDVVAGDQPRAELIVPEEVPKHMLRFG